MPFIKTEIAGLWIFEPRVFEDERGYFYESFNQKDFQEATGVDLPFVQDNHSLSKFGVIRGLHFQRPPFEQGKLVKVIRGEIFDVAVDIRRQSPTFGKWLGFKLSAENKRQLYIPRGFAHGFVVLSNVAEVLYKCDNFYAPQAEGGIIYNDPTLQIDWQIDLQKIVLSKKDASLPSFEHIKDSL